MDEANIVRTTYSEEASLVVPESGGRVRRFVRRLLRRSRLIKPAPMVNLFQLDLAAFRFQTDDGRACVVPVTKRLVDDASFDAEAYARQVAVEEFKKLGRS